MNREGPGKIGYLDFVWNPVVGCTNGCSYCWARRQAKRQKHNCLKCYDFVPHVHYDRTEEPLRKREPSAIGVAFMGDLFDQALPDTARVSVLDVMREASWHTFVALTKQPQLAKRFAFPPNLVLGVSPTDQESADRLVPELMECPAATRIVSIEPTQGPVNLKAAIPRGTATGVCTKCGWGETHLHKNRLRIGDRLYCPDCRVGALDGVILGGQTGPGAVPMRPDWVRKVRDDCAAAGVPFFFKQWGEWHPVSEYNFSTEMWRHGMIRVGRKRAGRTLDGRTHDELAWGPKPVRSAEFGVRSGKETRQGT